MANNIFEIITPQIVEEYQGFENEFEIEKNTCIICLDE